MDLKSVFEYNLKKDVEEKLLTKRGKKLKASDLTTVCKVFNIYVTLDPLEQKMLVEITDGGEIIYKDWLYVDKLFDYSYCLENLSYKIKRVKSGYSLNVNATTNEDYEDEDYEDED